MRNLTAITCVTLAILLSSCDSQNPASDIDPQLGVACFESHRSSFPPGTQYEGIEKLEDNRLTIRIMNGVEVVTLDCPMGPDGTLN